MDLTLTAFSETIRRRRRERGMTQTELANAVGTTRQWIAKVEVDARDVTLAKAIALAEELGLNLELRDRVDQSSADAMLAELHRAGVQNTARLRRQLEALRRAAIEVPVTTVRVGE